MRKALLLLAAFVSVSVFARIGVIEMEFIKDYSACTILQSNILIDERGKQYSPTYHSGLANCPELSTARSGHKFYWGFEELNKSAKVLKLKEDENMHRN